MSQSAWGKARAMNGPPGFANMTAPPGFKKPDMDYPPGFSPPGASKRDDVPPGFAPRSASNAPAPTHLPWVDAELHKSDVKKVEGSMVNLRMGQAPQAPASAPVQTASAASPPLPENPWAKRAAAAAQQAPQPQPNAWASRNPTMQPQQQQQRGQQMNPTPAAAAVPARPPAAAAPAPPRPGSGPSTNGRTAAPPGSSTWAAKPGTPGSIVSNSSNRSSSPATNRAWGGKKAPTAPEHQAPPTGLTLQQNLRSQWAVLDDDKTPPPDSRNSPPPARVKKNRIGPPPVTATGYGVTAVVADDYHERLVKAARAIFYNRIGIKKAAQQHNVTIVDLRHFYDHCSNEYVDEKEEDNDVERADGCEMSSEEPDW